MTRFAIYTAMICALALIPALAGQDPAPIPPPPPQQQQQQPQQPPQPKLENQADRQANAFTGCLMEQQGSFMLKTDGGEYSVVGSSDLSKHKNHTVRVTGTVKDDGGKKSLNATKVELVSTSCSK